MKTFLSWSGEASRQMAAFLRDWLPLVLPGLRPWMSEEDIDKGTFGIDQIHVSLADSLFGIVILTSENRNSPWINYEAGSLSQRFDGNTAHVAPLLVGLPGADVQGPLANRQWTNATRKEDVLRLLNVLRVEMTKLPNLTPLDEQWLARTFESHWPSFEEALRSLPQPADPLSAEQANDAEVLERLRAVDRKLGMLVGKEGGGLGSVAPIAIMHRVDGGLTMLSRTTPHMTGHAIYADTQRVVFLFDGTQDIDLVWTKDQIDFFLARVCERRWAAYVNGVRIDADGYIRMDWYRALKVPVGQLVNPANVLDEWPFDDQGNLRGFADLEEIARYVSQPLR